MKTLITVTLFFICSNLLAQCYTPDTTKIPLSRYDNAYAYFTGNDSGCFLRTRHFKALSLDYSMIDSFIIEWRMKLRHSDSTKHKYIFGRYDSSADKGWFISFNMVNVYDPEDPSYGFLEFYSDSLGFRKLNHIGFLDSNWHTYRIDYSKSSSRLRCIVDDTVRFADRNYNQGWNNTDTIYTFAVGYRYARNYWGYPPYIPVSPYYFNGYIDYLKIYYRSEDPADVRIFNWSFNEGAGQYVRDSADYKYYPVTWPDDGPSTPSFANLGKHLQSGLLGVQDKYDIVWFVENTSGSCPFSPMTYGVRFWSGAGSYTWSPHTLLLGVGVWDSNIVVVGNFNRVNASHVYYHNGDTANAVALWNPNNSPQWSALGNGINYTAAYVMSYNNDLIATGLFTLAGGNTANRIAKWNGSNWSSLGSGLSVPELYTRNCWGLVLEEWNDNLYVGGIFIYAGGDTCNYIAKWDGSDWSPLRKGLNADVWSLEVYNNYLYAGGVFTSPADTQFNSRGIIKWDGSNWHKLGRGVDQGCVFALCVYNNELWAGGDFTTMDDITCNGIAKYNDSTGQWSAVGSGIDGQGKVIYNMVVYNNELYITGSFYYMDGKAVNNICKWTGTEFCAISNGIDQQGKRMVVFNNELIIVGNFFEGDGVDFNNVLRYSSKGDIGFAFQTVSSSILKQNYPNPFNPKTTIKYVVPDKGLVKLTIYDILGREVKTLVNDIQNAGNYYVEFDATNYASGVYFYKVQAGNFVDVKKMVVVK